MTAPTPNDSPLFVRLTAEQKERLRKVARYATESGSMNEYATEALMRQVADDEALYAPIAERLEKLREE